jgi:hypothetical protein
MRDKLDYTPETPETVHFFTESLLSKWGFGDGDDLNWLYEHNRDYDPHATLIECVRRRMLPALKQKVEIREIVCRHNPCRAGTVDGVDVTHLWYDPDLKLDPPLSPDFVVMTGAEIVAIAEELRHNSENTKDMPPERSA